VQLREVHDPYYLTFTDPSVDAVRNLLRLNPTYWEQFTKFKHHALPEDVGQALIEQVPCWRQLKLWSQRVSIFVTPPRTYYRAHRDGYDLMAGLNYPLHIADDRSITRFWNDEQVLGMYKVDAVTKRSRELVNFNPYRQQPVCQFTMKPDEAVVLNVGNFHDFHNRSDQHRVILTFRTLDKDMTYERFSSIVKEACSSPASHVQTSV